MFPKLGLWWFPFDTSFPGRMNGIEYGSNRSILCSRHLCLHIDILSLHQLKLQLEVHFQHLSNLIHAHTSM